MAMDVSKLAIEVESKGINEAREALGRLSRTAGTTDKRVTSLTANLEKLSISSGALTGRVSGLTGTMALINAALEAAGAKARGLSADLDRVTMGMAAVTRTSNRTSSSLERQSRWYGTIRTTLKAMTVAFIAYQSVNIVKSIIDAGDSWQTMQAKLKIATGGMDNAKVSQEALFKMSQKLRVPLEDLTKLFTRLAPTMRNNGKSFEQATEMVEGVSLALKLNGATAGEASSVMLQFSQAMQKGRLDGAEFNAVAENGSLIMRALEKSTGKSSGELKKLGSTGKLTFEELQTAIEKALPQWRKDFAELPVTVEDASQRIKNAWLKAMGEMSQDSGLNKGLVSALAVFEQMIPAVRDELIGAFVGLMGWVKENRENIGEIWTQIKGIVGDAWELVGAFGNVSRAIIGAGDDFSVIGFAIYAARLGVAGLIDGFTLIGAAVLKVGSFIISSILSPLLNVSTGVLKVIIDRITSLISMLASAADFVGLDKIAAGLKQAADVGDNLSRTITDVQDGFKGVGESMAQSATDAFNMIANGEGAVARVLNEEQKITMEVAKRSEFNKKAWNKAPGLAPKKAVDEAAESARKKAIKAANAELERSLQLYLRLAEVNELINKHGLEWDKLTEGQKEQIKLERALVNAKDATVRKLLEQALANNAAAQEIERANKHRLDALNAEKEFGKTQDAAIASAKAELVTLQDKVNGYGQVKGAVEAVTLAKALENLEDLKKDGATSEQIAKQTQLVEVLRQVQAAKAELGQLENLDKLNKFLDKDKVADFGRGFGDAFGKVGKAIDKAGKSLDQYQKKMVENAKQQKVIDGITDPEKKFKATERLRRAELKDTLDMYGDMAGAVKDFFDEKTVAYKVFDAFEKGIRIAQMALTMQEFLMKMANEDTWIGKKIASTLQAMSLDNAETTNSVGNSMTKAGASTVAGAGKAFEQMGIWGFIGAAAIIAFMAAMGSGTSGGTSPPADISKERQSRQGAGTVLGDDEAKSESIKNSLDRMRENSNIGLEYTASMVASLRNIEMNISGLTGSIARVSGMTTGSNFNVGLGTQSGGGLFGISSLFGKEVTKEIQDTGLMLNGSLSDLLSGQGIKQYLDILQTTKKNGFFGIGSSTSSSSFREQQGVNGEVSSFIGDILSGLRDSIISTGGALGKDEGDIARRLDQHQISQEISLKDLKGDDLEKTLQAIFSASADDMAKMIFPEFSEFQRAGEGYFETITRVASGTERAKDALGKLGVNMVNISDLQQKNGDIDTELVRESLMREESGTSLAKILKLIDGSMEDLVNSYKELTRIRNIMASMGVDSDSLSLSLIRGAGGIRELADSFSTFTEDFFTEEEQVAMKMNQLTMEFGRLGIQVPASRAAFRALVTQLMGMGDAGEEMAGRILSLSGVFSDAMELYDEVDGQKISDARDALSEAYDREAEALENTRQKMQDFAKSLREFKDSLIMGDLSPLSVMEKYQTALAKYEDVSTRAMAGDEDAIGEFQNVASELLKFSQEVNASGAGYMADFQRVLNATDVLAQFTQGQADQATTQLDMLKTQVESLIEIEESTKTVAEAMVELIALMGGTSTAATNVVQTELADGTQLPSLDGSTTIENPTVETTPAATAAAMQAAANSKTNSNLIAEVQGLRAELASLRAEAREQTGAKISAEYDASDRAANKVVEGFEKVAGDVLYEKRPWERLST